MKQKIFVRSQFNYDTDEVSQMSGLMCEDESLAQQHQKEEADINTIVRRFGLTGQLPENVRIPQYGDFTGITDYQTALNAVKQAQDSFMELPWELRKRFNNDPEQFVDFCLDPENADEAVKLGLAVDTRPKKDEQAAPEPEAKEAAGNRPKDGK